MAQPAQPATQPAKPAEQSKPAAQPTVVEQPKPAEAEQPATPAQPRRRAPKTGSALSISAIAVEKETPDQAGSDDAAAGNTDTRLPDDDTVRLKWKELAGQYTSKPRLASMLSSGQINLSEDAGVKVVEFVVMNEAQKQWVEEKMQRELETKLRDLLSCRKVNIVVAVTPEPENAEKVPYMPEEKAKDLMEKNPAVREFVAEMGLDTK